MRAARSLALSAAPLGLVLVVAAGGCSGHPHAAASGRESPLGIVSAATPRFPVAHISTRGTVPQARGGKLALGGVNGVLRQAIVSDQRTLARRYAKRKSGQSPSGPAGFYSTELVRTLVSASTVLVSVLIPREQDLLPAQAPTSGWRGWLGITIRVPSGTRVRLPDLFARRAQAMRVLAASIRSDRRLDRSVSRHPLAALADPQFALLPDGLGVGVVEVGWSDTLLVPYRALRPYLSKLGLELVAGARWPDFRPDRHHLSYCRRPDNSGAELSATGDVPCTTARSVERKVFSTRCASRTRCRAVGFVCLAYWSGRHDQPFALTHHAVCHDRKRRIVMDEG